LLVSENLPLRTYTPLPLLEVKSIQELLCIGYIPRLFHPKQPSYMGSTVCSFNHDCSSTFRFLPCIIGTNLCFRDVRKKRQVDGGGRGRGVGGVADKELFVPRKLFPSISTFLPAISFPMSATSLVYTVYELIFLPSAGKTHRFAPTTVTS
jgi:hypothetical protein